MNNNNKEIELKGIMFFAYKDPDTSMLTSDWLPLKVTQKPHLVPNSTKGYYHNFDLVQQLKIPVPNGENIYHTMLYDVCDIYQDRNYWRLCKTGTECKKLLEQSKYEKGDPYIIFKPDKNNDKGQFYAVPITEDSYFLGLKGDIAISNKLKKEMKWIWDTVQEAILNKLMQKIIQLKAPNFDKELPFIFTAPYLINPDEKKKKGTPTQKQLEENETLYHVTQNGIIMIPGNKREEYAEYCKQQKNQTKNNRRKNEIEVL